MSCARPWYLVSGRFAHPTLAGFVPLIGTYLPGHMLRHGVLGLAGIVFMLALRSRDADRSDLARS